MNTIRFLFITSLLVFPAVASADIEISEIMYDVEGTDSGNEWIEIHNTSSESIDLEDWSFRENEVNHGLQFPDSTVIKANEYIVIVQNIEPFEATYGSAIKIIKSSFSLNNTGELLEIVNENDEVTDSHRYSSEAGAQGDGESLQKYDGEWKASLPTPGSENIISENNDNTDHNNDDNTSNESDEVDDNHEHTKKEFEDYYEPYISFPDVVVAHSPERFEIGVFHIREDSKTRKLKGVYYVNFGDGTVTESHERIDIMHRYPAAGSYMLTLEFYTSQLQYNHSEPQLVYQKKVDVVDPSIEIVGTDGNGGVLLTNTGTKNIDISGWKLGGVDLPYIFPKYSIIRPSSTIAVSYTSLGFWIDEYIVSQLYLENDNHLLIHRYRGLEKEQTIQSSTQLESSDDIDLGEHTINLDEEVHTYEYQPEVPPESSSSNKLLVIAGVCTVAVGCVRFLYVKYKSLQKIKNT